MRHALVAVALVMMLVPLGSGAQDTTGTAWPVGAIERRFVPPGDYNWRAAATRELITTVWYPAAATARPSLRVIGPPAAPLFTLGNWADAPGVANGRFPLIVLSHGTGGSAQMMAWLASALATRGYVVAAVNHPGNNALEDYTAEGFLLWWERARDLSVVLDFVLKDPQIGSAIDPRRIGAAGFSLGGYTMFALAGARTDPAALRAFCRSAQAEGCVDPPEFPNLFARWDQLERGSAAFRAAMSRAGDSYRDDRVRAVFAIAPALGPALTPDSLRNIEIPVGIVAGSDDSLVPVRSNAETLARLTTGATLTLLPSVGHYTFLATCTDAGRSAQPILCTDAAGIDRDAVHRRASDLAAGLFDRTLR